MMTMTIEVNGIAGDDCVTQDKVTEVALKMSDNERFTEVGRWLEVGGKSEEIA